MIALLRRSVLLAAVAIVAASCSPCDDVSVNFSATCLPQRVSPFMDLDIELQEACGSSCSEPPVCTSILDLNMLTLISAQTECTQDCVPTGVCVTRKVRCLLPPLDPGVYSVVIPGLPPRQLTVEPGQPVACAL